MTRTAIIVDDHPMCRAAAGMALAAVDASLDVTEAASIAEARLRAHGATLMTLDLGLPDSRGVLGLAELRGAFPDVPILVISGAANPATEREVARLGATGFLSKAAPLATMVEAMRALLGGGGWFSADLDRSADNDDFTRLAGLTPGQRRVLDAMEGGRLNKQIAYDLGLSEITVKAHIKAILKKLGVANRTQAVLVLQRVAA